MKAAVSLVALLVALTGITPAYAAPKQKAQPVAAQANLTPAETVRNFYTKLTEVMKQGDDLGFAGRYKKLEPVLSRSYNFPLMTRFAVGLLWNDASPQEQEQITKAFTQFSIATYANRFAKYDGEQFTVSDEKPTADGKIVTTTLQPKEGDPVTLNYLMKQDENGSWRIVDVYMNGTISELATRRAEFSSVIKRDGIAALVNSLSEKSKPVGPT